MRAAAEAARPGAPRMGRRWATALLLLCAVGAAALLSRSDASMLLLQWRARQGASEGDAGASAEMALGAVAAAPAPAPEDAAESEAAEALEGATASSSGAGVGHDEEQDAGLNTGEGGAVVAASAASSAAVVAASDAAAALAATVLSRVLPRAAQPCAPVLEKLLAAEAAYARRTRGVRFFTAAASRELFHDGALYAPAALSATVWDPKRRTYVDVRAGAAADAPGGGIAALRLAASGGDRLMIVSHPDDELIFGGAMLAAGGDTPPRRWVVVFATQDNVRRVRGLCVEWQLAACVALPHADSPFLRAWDARLVRDVAALLTLRPWAFIVTHGASGEYGHPQHRDLHHLVATTAAGAVRRGVRVDLRFFHHGGAAAQRQNARSAVTRRRRDAIHGLYSVNAAPFVPYIAAYQEALPQSIDVHGERRRLRGKGQPNTPPTDPTIDAALAGAEAALVRSQQFKDLPMDAPADGRLHHRSVCIPQK